MQTQKKKGKVEKESQKEKQEYKHKTIGGIINNFRSPVSFKYRNFKRGVTLHISMGVLKCMWQKWWSWSSYHCDNRV